MLTTDRVAYVFAAAATFGVLVFSYIYLWTAALAWLFCVSLLWAAMRRTLTKRLVALAALMVVPLIPYIYLLSNRHSELDAAQTKVFTHAPDLFECPRSLGCFSL